MASHAMLDNVNVVSYAGPPKSGAPLDGDSGIETEVTPFFSSIEAMDQALLDDVGTSQTNIDRMSVNDKVYALRKFLEDGGVLTSLSASLPAITEDTVGPVAQVEPWGAVWFDTTANVVYQTTGGGNWTQIST